MLIGVVGPCAAGKTTLINGLKRHDIEARHIAQEHSYVADMWQRLTHPDILVYLDVSYPVTLERRKMDWNEREYREQIDRLEHARRNANLYIHTDPLTPEQVLEQVLTFVGQLNQSGV
jgi:deoxyadenosine/deoxycytidine kinase